MAQASEPGRSDDAPETGLSVDFQEADHIGKRKKEQQDAHGHLTWPGQNDRPAGHLFVVCDGVSMGQAGALASRSATDTLLASFQKQLDDGQSDLSLALERAFQAANNEVYTLSRTRPGMATTCVVALITGQSLVTVHAGDSRAYLYRTNLDLMPVTVDHSWLTEMGELLVQQGVMSQQDLLRDQRRHTITRAFGLQLDMPGDFNSAQLQPGDLVILCSDGLWDLLPSSLLETASREGRDDLPGLSKRLVEAALNAGGRDNITVTLARVDRLGEPARMPGLDAMLERTAQEVAARTRPIQVESSSKNIAARPTVPQVATTAYQPIGVEENEPLEDVPSLKISVPNPEMILAKAQKSFALGEWNEAIDSFIEVEQLEASFTGLFESFSNSLIRYVGVAVGEGQQEYVEQLINRLEAAHILRYHELLADYCNEESRRTAAGRYYAAAKAYAQVCLRLRPNDVRARTLIELSELYLAMERPRAPLNERLAVAQKIYARDESFGVIQDDLAKIYMEMGDEATRQRVLEDAANWYGMVLPLRPADKRLLTLAGNKQRSAEDELTRRGGASNSLIAKTPSPLPTGNDPTNQAGTLKPHENRAEQEQINRLKERVSRAQKAWDGGRREIGGEYIYLVDQLNELVTPNLWQPTFPRVCYDYGKWLLDQKQYAEARPFFQKAHQLGMAAAQQRLNEIDRLLRERQPINRHPVAQDVAESPSVERRSVAEPLFDTTSAEPPRSVNRTTLFSSRRSSATPIGPIVPPRPDATAANQNFVGSSHAGDGVLTPNRAPENGPPPRSAAVVAAGNWNRQAGEESPPPLPLTENMPVGQTAPLSGTLRQPNAGRENDPVQGAANREATRLAGTGLPQSLDPRQAAQRRWMARINLLKGVVPLVLGLVIVGAAIVLLVTLVILPGLNKNDQPVAANATATAGAGEAATPETGAALADATPTVVPPAGVQGVVRIEGAKPDDVRVFLADAGNPNSLYRELNLENTFFRLPVATLNHLDPKQKYLIVVRPKDTTDRTFASNLSPDNPAQQPFVSPNFDFDAAKGFDLTLMIKPEALAYYPLQGNATDQDVPNGRYFGAVHHSVRGDYLKFYNANGGLARFGFPLSEEFEWAGQGRVQFFERGWLSVTAAGQPVTIGKIGRSVLDSACGGTIKLPATTTPLAVPTLKPDPDFDKVATTLKLGLPQSQPFETGPPTKLKVQYFELGRLELLVGDKAAKPTLGLLGSEYSRCVGWLK